MRQTETCECGLACLAIAAEKLGEITHGTPDRVDISITTQAGEVVVAYVHSHPDNGINQTLPSRENIEAAGKLRELANVDKGLMLYILDNLSVDVFEYNADTPRNTTRTGPNISDDMTKPWSATLALTA